MCRLEGESTLETLLPRVLLINLRTHQPYPLVEGFRSIGCPVHSLHLWPDQKEQHTIWVEKAVNEFRPDFILSYGWWQGSVDMDALGKILKRYSIPHAYWATEDPLFFEEISKPILSCVDYVFTVAHECVARYEAENVPASTLPHACGPSRH